MDKRILHLLPSIERKSCNTELRRGGAETKTMLLFSVVLCAIFVVLRVKVFLSIQNIASVKR